MIRCISNPFYLYACLLSLSPKEKSDLSYPIHGNWFRWRWTMLILIREIKNSNRSNPKKFTINRHEGNTHTLALQAKLLISIDVSKFVCRGKIQKVKRKRWYSSTIMQDAHVAFFVQMKQQELLKEILLDLAYSSVIASSDYHLVWSTQRFLAEQHFQTYPDNKNWVDYWCRESLYFR